MLTTRKALVLSGGKHLTSASAGGVRLTTATQAHSQYSENIKVHTSTLYGCKKPWVTKKIYERVEKKKKTKTVALWFLHNGPYKLMYLILNASEGAKRYIAISKLTMILSAESLERDQEGDTLGRQREKQVNKDNACLRWSASSSTS